jgi:hypothetical protein
MNKIKNSTCSFCLFVLLVYFGSSDGVLDCLVRRAVEHLTVAKHKTHVCNEQIRVFVVATSLQLHAHLETRRKRNKQIHLFSKTNKIIDYLSQIHGIANIIKILRNALFFDVCIIIYKSKADSKTKHLYEFDRIDGLTEIELAVVALHEPMQNTRTLFNCQFVNPSCDFAQQSTMLRFRIAVRQLLHKCFVKKSKTGLCVVMSIKHKNNKTQQNTVTFSLLIRSVSS